MNLKSVIFKRDSFALRYFLCMIVNLFDYYFKRIILERKCIICINKCGNHSILKVKIFSVSLLRRYTPLLKKKKKETKFD